jgi:aspartate beta-hydroxylase
MRVQDLEELISAVRAHHPRTDLSRLEDNLAAFARGEQRVSPAPLQRPRYWYKGLPDRPWHDRERYAAIPMLEASYPVIRDDLERLLEDRRHLQRFRGGDAATMAEYIHGDHSVFYFRDQFAPDSEQPRMQHNREIAARTSAVLDSLPRLGETAFFSIMGPGTHLRPHHGAENLRVFVHLGVIITDGCAIRVADREVVWEEGKCIVFDDSYEHEAWNRGRAVRTILLVELWHHDLSDAEIEFFQRLSVLTRASPPV